ncbi:uncharacterized protein TNCT_125321 [Trichonephila clavata]|uniref:RING-type domain-containing protein n=1 Tax=Trichonephila clavata TaxID=2740835 RepID=A0A8X6LBS9_TRICU|nr:uncharacterized protein TNCT_125321 [Trichonephila clavata]
MEVSISHQSIGENFDISYAVCVFSTMKKRSDAVEGFVPSTLNDFFSTLIRKSYVNSANEKKSSERGTITMSHITTALHEDINSERQKAASSDEAVIIDVVPHSSISESDGLRVIIQKKIHEDTFVLSLSIPKLFDYPQENLKRILDEALKHIYEIDILDGLENFSVSYLWHHNNQSINIHYTSNEEFGHHKLTSYIYSYEKASVRNALEMKYGEQEFVSSDCCLSNKSVINDADFPVVIPLHDLSSFACITPEVIENVNESEDNNLPHPQHPSNRFIDIPHRSNEGYDHELTSNISSCEKVSVTNALETISGEQKDQINVAIYSSFPAIDSLKPKIRNKLSGGKKKLPNQNSSNIQFAFSELFDHRQEKYERNVCAASECRSQVIGDVCELENNTVPYRNNEIQSVDIPQTCNEDFNPCTSTGFVSGFEKLYVGNIEDEKNPSFDNGILNEAVFNDVVHSPISAIDSLESRNDERKFSGDKLDSKPIEPLQESTGDKQSVGFNRTSSSMEKHKMFFSSFEIKPGKNLSCLRNKSSGKNAKKGAKKASDKKLSFVPADLLSLGEEKGEVFYNTNGEPVGHEDNYILNKSRMTVSGWLLLPTVCFELVDSEPSSSDYTIEEQMNDGARHVLDMPESTPAAEGYPPSTSCSNAPGSKDPCSQTPGCEDPLSQGTDEGLKSLPCLPQENESQADRATNIPLEIPSEQQPGTSDGLFISGREKVGECSVPHSFNSHQESIEYIPTMPEAIAQSTIIETYFDETENSSAPFRQHYEVGPSQSQQNNGTHIDSLNSVSVIRRVIRKSNSYSSDEKEGIPNRKGPTSPDDAMRHGTQNNLSDSISFSDVVGKNSVEQVSMNILQDGYDSPIPFSTSALSDPCVHQPVNNENNPYTTCGSIRSLVIRTSSNGPRSNIMTSSDLGAHNSICISKGREILDAGKSCDDDAYSKKFLDQPSTLGDIDRLIIVKTDNKSAQFVAAETHTYMEESESDPWEVKLQKTMLAIERTEREIQEMKFADYKKRVSEKGVQNMIHYLTCLICEETLQEAVLLSCKHMFCKLCIQQWAEKIGTCPVCKKDINYLMNDARINDFINRSYEHLNPEFQRKRRALKFVREKLGESLSFLKTNGNVVQIESSNNEEKVYQLDKKDQGVPVQIILATANRVFPDNRELTDEASNRSSSNN